MNLGNTELTNALRAFLPIRPDFPIHGVQFIDILPLIGDHPELYTRVIETLCTNHEILESAGIVTVESRGLLFAAPVAATLRKPLLLVRKAGKTPPPVLSMASRSEYDAPQLELQVGRVQPGGQYALIDDVLATGGTALAAGELLTMGGGSLHSAHFLAELPALGGRGKLSPVPCLSFLEYDFQ
jgi:adenine phosphoribosyltransferase